MINRIKIGLAAEILLIKIFTSNEFHNEFLPFGAGIFKTRSVKPLFIAFDNIQGHCWVEEFTSLSAAFNWLKNGTEGTPELVNVTLTLNEPEKP